LQVHFNRYGVVSLYGIIVVFVLQFVVSVISVVGMDAFVAIAGIDGKILCFIAAWSKLSGLGRP
jgi:hypothetical protein